MPYREDGRAVKITVNVNHRDRTGVLIEELWHCVLKPTFDERAIRFCELRWLRFERPFWAGPPIFRDAVKRIEAINMPFRAIL